MHFLKACALALQAAAFVHGQKWTLHESCLKDTEIRDAIVESMKSAKDRSANAATKLEESKNDKKEYGFVRSAAILFLEDKNYGTRVDEAKKLIDGIAKLEGPIGAGDDPATSYSNSKDWKELFEVPEGKVPDEWWPYVETYKNFIIYCAPDLGKKDNGYGNLLPADLARDVWIKQDSKLIVMRDETAAGKYKDEKKIAQAITNRDEPPRTDKKGNPEGQRRNIPETITFHPLYLKDLKARKFNKLDDDRIDLVSKSSAWGEFRDLGIKPTDAMIGSLEGLVQHEMFHLSIFGGLKDSKDENGNSDAYGWDNCVRLKNLANPETLAYLITVVDLADKKKLQFNGEGRITKGR